MKTIPASLAGFLPAELENILLPLPRMRASQIYKWITRGVPDFDQMTDLPASLREDLKSRFRLYSSAVDSRHEDKSSEKTVIALEDGLKIESVLLKDGKSRFTACLSTQAGCPAGCVFCKQEASAFPAI